MEKTNNGLYTRIKTNLEFLKSKESLAVLDETIDYVTRNNSNFFEGFLHFTESQMEIKRRNLQLHAVKMAGFPRLKYLKDFEFEYQPTINENQIYELNSLRFVEKKENVVFYGNSGVGKTHLATAIGITAAENRMSTYFIKCADLMTTLKKAHLEGRLEDKLKKLGSYKLLIIDEVGYLPISKEESKLFFQLIDRRYEKFSTIITTNISFSQWDEIFGDSIIANAIIDRLLHHAQIISIKGRSFRLKELYLKDEE